MITDIMADLKKDKPFWVMLSAKTIKQLPVGLLADLVEADGIKDVSDDDFKRYEKFLGKKCWNSRKIY